MGYGLIIIFQFIWIFHNIPFDDSIILLNQLHLLFCDLFINLLKRIIFKLQFVNFLHEFSTLLITSRFSLKLGSILLIPNNVISSLEG